MDLETPVLIVGETITWAANPGRYRREDVRRTKGCLFMLSSDCDCDVTSCFKLRCLGFLNMMGCPLSHELKHCFFLKFSVRTFYYSNSN